MNRTNRGLGGSFMRKSLGIGIVALVVLAMAASAVAGDGHPMLQEINDTLAAMGEDVRVEYAEFVTTEDAPDFANTIYANNRGNKRLSSDWVPGDPRRFGVDNILWTIDQVNYTNDVSQADQNAAVDRAMGTWQDVMCSSIPLTKVPDGGLDLGYVQWLLGYGGVPGWLADLTHAGWLPGSFFDAVAPGGSGYILGVTFTFTWSTDPDMDGNGRSDVAFREIYYNDAFTWAIDGNYDVETIALHEAGHGLSQGHFGKIFRSGGNGALHFSPRAVMNAAYSGVQQELTGTDVGGHCANWGSWPNN